jgi:hypothetical protein
MDVSKVPDVHSEASLGPMCVMSLYPCKALLERGNLPRRSILILSVLAPLSLLDAFCLK